MSSNDGTEHCLPFRCARRSDNLRDRNGDRIRRCPFRDPLAGGCHVSIVDNVFRKLRQVLLVLSAETVDAQAQQRILQRSQLKVFLVEADSSQVKGSSFGGKSVYITGAFHDDHYVLLCGRGAASTDLYVSTRLSARLSTSETCSSERRWSSGTDS